MLRIRLTRKGTKKKPYYRVVVAERRSRRDGRFVEIVGHYDPRHTSSEAVTLNMDRVHHWISKGAQPSETVRSLINRANRQVVAPPA